MKYLLDTNTCIRFLNGQSPAVSYKLRSLPVDEITVCSVVKAELFYGSARSSRPQQTRQEQQEFLSRFHSLPFDDNAADQYAIIRANLTVSGTPIGPNDMLIAAIALANNLILVTHNVAEFNRVPSLIIEDWET